MGIRNFRHKGLREIFEDGRSSRLGKNFHKNALLILDHLNAISNLDDCKGVKGLHSLKGKRKGTYAMHVSGNYVITFKWDNGDVIDVNFEDYH